MLMMVAMAGDDGKDSDGDGWLVIYDYALSFMMKMIMMIVMTVEIMTTMAMMVTMMRGQARRWWQRGYGSCQPWPRAATSVKIGAPTPRCQESRGPMY